MPLVLFLLAIAYVVSIRLRGSGLVFGSESFAWTMANRIGVKRHANDNTMLRLVFISPEAWRRQEVAHCYYYKADSVIEDVAGYMADWSRHAPSRFLPFGGWIGRCGALGGGCLVRAQHLRGFGAHRQFASSASPSRRERRRRRRQTPSRSPS